jgi:hypothetical protein
MTLKATWIDSGREPKSPPNPKFPDGVDIDLSRGQRSCQVPLDYPAPRCGYHLVVCRTCKLRVVVTTAGRRDDPRSVKVACK